jgi:hypothetical protein
LKTIWIGLIFLVSLWGNEGGPKYGLSEEYFSSELECWEYFDNHLSFKLIKEYKHNFYDINSRVKNYEILEVGKAWVSCKNISTVPPDEHNHDHEHHKGEQ